MSYQTFFFLSLKPNAWTQPCSTSPWRTGWSSRWLEILLIFMPSVSKRLIVINKIYIYIYLSVFVCVCGWVCLRLFGAFCCIIQPWRWWTWQPKTWWPQPVVTVASGAKSSPVFSPPTALITRSVFVVLPCFCFNVYVYWKHYNITHITSSYSHHTRYSSLLLTRTAHHERAAGWGLSLHLRASQPRGPPHGCGRWRGQDRCRWQGFRTASSIVCLAGCVPSLSSFLFFSLAVTIHLRPPRLQDAG